MKYERNQEILELYNKGYTCSKIGEMYNITRQNVSRIVKNQKRRNDSYELNFKKEKEWIIKILEEMKEG